MNKSILFVMNWSEDTGGMWNWIANVCQLVAEELFEHKINSYIAYPKIDPNKKNDQCLIKIEIDLANVDLFAVKKLIDNQNIKVIVFIDTPYFWSKIPLFKFLGVKVIHYKHFGYTGNEKVNNCKILLKKLFNSCYFLSYDGYIAINNSMLDNFNLLDGIKRSKATLIHNGIDLEKFNKNSNQIFENDLNLPRSQYYVLSISNIFPEKRVDLIVEIAYEVLKVIPDVCFVHVGEGGDRQKVESKIKELNLTNNFILVGKKSNVTRYLNIATVFIHPSIREGFGNVISEALAFNIPIVASNIEGIKDQIIHNETGYLCPVDRKEIFVQRTIDLLSDENKRLEFGIAARKRVEEHFSIQKQVESLEKYFLTFFD